MGEGSKMEGQDRNADIKHEPKETVTQFGCRKEYNSLFYGHAGTGQLPFCVCIGYDCNFVCSGVRF